MVYFPYKGVNLMGRFFSTVRGQNAF